MTIDKFFGTYKNLLASAIICFIGIKTWFDPEGEYLDVLFFLTIALGFVLNFIALKTENKKQAKILNYITYTMASMVVLFSSRKMVNLNFNHSRSCLCIM